MDKQTDALRAASADWSLAGDRQLLTLLHNIHQKITSKCQEATAKLDEMVAGLDNASVSLQNVNNRFMALSNSQFVESRVYDDDTDADVSNKQPQIAPKAAQQDSLSYSLSTIEATHEPVTILDDSDSDSDSDDRERESVLILRPKDMYAERPLPYIIGSQHWKNKWHAGLILESDSDTDSTTSKRTDRQTEEFSESESDYDANSTYRHDEYEKPEEVVVTTPIQPPVDVYRPPAKLYKPYTPTAPMFPDEPPPLDEGSEGEVPSSDSEHDIFAGMLKSTDSRNNIVQPPIVQKQSLFQEQQDSDSDDEQDRTPIDNDKAKKIERDETKKPIGAISLFGSNAGAASIGAAILKRHQRKSSDESDDSRPNEGIPPSLNKVESQPKSMEKEQKSDVKENSIFDELFAKSTKSSVEVKKVDIFSDIFDDVDDIFAKDRKQDKVVKTNIFDDDLFNDIDVESKVHDVFEKPPLEVNTSKIITKDKPKQKSIFDDDYEDNLFAEKEKPKTVKPLPEQTNKIKSKSIFDSDSDDGDIFSKLKPPTVEKQENNTNTKDIFNDDKLNEQDKTTEVSVIKNINVESTKDPIHENLNINKEIENPEKDDDDWETDIPSDENENQPVVLKNPENTGKLNKTEFDNNDTNKEVITEKQPIENKPKFDDIFRDEPPPLEDIKPKHKEDIEKSDLASENKEPEINTNTETIKNNIDTDIFDDLFNQGSVGQLKSDIFSDAPPPLIEKTKETKNTNINALFGDDSDDESIFFKTDTLIDDVPPKTDALDSIFHDEPPDLDIDFMSEPSFKTGQMALKTDQSESIKNVLNNDEQAIPENVDQSESVQNTLTNEEISVDTVDKLDKTHNPKPVGKLKPVNFNINVNTLLPGASPKKVIKNPAKIDSPISPNNETVTSPVKSVKPIDSPVKKEPAAKDGSLSKSVSFDSDPDSLILDNKISKERAKIQVKRRPSTRRARIEAVRKSGIDFVDSDSQNVKIEDKDLDSINKSQDVIDTVEVGNQDSTDASKKVIDKIENADFIDKNVEVKDVTHVLNINSEDVYIFTETKTDKNVSKEDTSIFDNILSKPSKIDSDKDFRITAKSGRRLVITDDDDDIFTKKTKITTKSKITDDNADIFKTIKTDSKSFLDDIDDDDLFNFKPANNNTDGIKTLGNTYKEPKQDTKRDYKPLESTKSIVEESSKTVEKTKQSTKPVEKTTKSEPGNTKGSKPKAQSLFDDSSDDELFGGKKTKMADSLFSKTDDLFSKSIEKVNKSGKKTLFDDSDDDDLFATKKTDTATKSQSTSGKPKAQEISTQEPTFQDPLSMFDD